MDPEYLIESIGSPQLIIMAVWVLFWKGIALWRAAKNDQKIWYVCILIINLMGLLEIIYLLFFQKEGKLWPSAFVKKEIKK
ncbi:hypothetical protein FJZ41_02455 [Candidatus Shapirobacteria bacterium]|nr:hypothetical protein [Candidatus Shapirobacteria bacterium]